MGDTIRKKVKETDRTPGFMVLQSQVDERTRKIQAMEKDMENLRKELEYKNKEIGGLQDATRDKDLAITMFQDREKRGLLVVGFP